MEEAPARAQGQDGQQRPGQQPQHGGALGLELGLGIELRQLHQEEGPGDDHEEGGRHHAGHVEGTAPGRECLVIAAGEYPVAAPAQQGQRQHRRRGQGDKGPGGGHSRYGQSGIRLESGGQLPAAQEKAGRAAHGGGHRQDKLFAHAFQSSLGVVFHLEPI